ncbi:hypothetical protein [Pseudogulbenkiania ferrooxidans]|uniref:hypothetical protein n=1 Tax=Pseudogulbenkiania ferrooxidans TaxID=549169 RepID=UPI001F3E0AE7|nr:hypothetical protein [Pseudogulbenkiania ferrooxidans]
MLTDVVEEAAPPVLAEEPPFELPDFDFSGELDAMATAMPDAAAIELEIPELPLDDVLDVGPMPASNEPVVDFSNLPSLDLDVAALDELALGEVLPELQKAVPVPPENEAAPAGDLGAGVFDFVLTPATTSAEPAPLPDSALDIPELTMEWSEPVAAPDVQSESATVASVPDSVGLARPVSIPWPTDDVPEAAVAIVPTADQDQGRVPDGVSGDGQVEPDVAAAEPVVDRFASWAENVEVDPTPLMDVATEPVLAQQRIDIDSLPSGVLGGGVGPEPSSSWAVTYAPSGEGDELASVPALPELDVSFVETTEVHNLPAEEPPSPSAGVAESPTEVDGNAWLEQFVNGELTELSAAANETEEVQPSVHEEVALDLPHGIGLAEAAAGLDSVAVDLPVLEEEEPPILASELDELLPGASGSSELGTSAMSPDRATMLDHVVPVDGDLKDGAAGVTTVEVEASFMPESSVAAVSSPVPQPGPEAMPDAVAPLLERPEPVVGADTVVEKSPEPSCAVVDEQALIDSLTQKILPRMKVELSLWLQDALEMQARQMLAGVMHQLKEDYEMLFNETLRESLRQAISEIGRDERDGKS